MATTITNWTEFDAAITAGDLDLLITGAVVFPAATTRTVPEKVSIRFEGGGYFDFQDDEDSHLIIDGSLDASPKRWIFRNVSVCPEDPGWGQGASGSPASMAWNPNVYGKFREDRHTGWWGALDGVNGKVTIQNSMDSGEILPIGRGSVVTVLAAVSHPLPEPIQLYGRWKPTVTGDAAHGTRVVASSGTGWQDYASGSNAMFYHDLPNLGSGSGWAFGYVFKKMNLEANVVGLHVFRFFSIAEGSLFEDLQGSWGGAFIHNYQNAIGGVVRQCHFTASEYSTEDSRVFLLSTATNGAGQNPRGSARLRISDITFNAGRRGFPAFMELRGGSVTATQIHIEATRIGFLLGTDTPSSRRPISLTASNIDFSRMNPPTPGDVLTAQNCVFGVRDWKYTQINASSLTIGPGAGSSAGEFITPYDKGARDTWWLKCLADDQPRDGEIPMNQANQADDNRGDSGSAQGTGQSSFGTLIFNGRGYRNPSLRVPGVRTAEDGSLCHGHDVIGPGPEWLSHKYDVDDYLSEIADRGATVTPTQEAAVRAFYAKDWFNRYSKLHLWLTAWGSRYANQTALRDGSRDYLNLSGIAQQDSVGLHGDGVDDKGVLTGEYGWEQIGATPESLALICLCPVNSSDNGDPIAGSNQSDPEISVGQITLYQSIAGNAWVFRGNQSAGNGQYNAVVNPREPAVVMGVVDGTDVTIHKHGASGYSFNTVAGVPPLSRVVQTAPELFKVSSTGGLPPVDGAIGVFGLSGEAITGADAQELLADLKTLYEAVSGNTL